MEFDLSQPIDLLDDVIIEPTMRLSQYRTTCEVNRRPSSEGKDLGFGGATAGKETIE